MECRTCGTTYSDGTRVCWRCDHPLHRRVVRLCRHCGLALSRLHAGCWYCGADSAPGDRTGGSRRSEDGRAAVVAVLVAGCAALAGVTQAVFDLGLG